MDAAVMVNYSRAWHTVPEQVKCEIAKPTGYRYEGLFHVHLLWFKFILGLNVYFIDTASLNYYITNGKTSHLYINPTTMFTLKYVRPHT